MVTAIERSIFTPAPGLHAAQYRCSAGIVVCNERGLVWAGHRRSLSPSVQAHFANESNSIDQAWQLPQGGIDPHETPLEAAKRELYEETGISSVVLKHEVPEWLYYEFPRTRGVADYHGQRQKWFFFQFTGDEAEIALTRPNMSPEFDDWRWMPLTELTEMVIPFRRPIYEHLSGLLGLLE